MTTRYEQLTHIDMNWCDEQTPEAAECRKAESKLLAERIAVAVRNPEHGVHAQAVETLAGWAVEVVHNALTSGEATFKRHAVAGQYRWHHNDVDEDAGIGWLIADGWSQNDAQAVADRCHGREPKAQIKDHRWRGV